MEKVFISENISFVRPSEKLVNDYLEMVNDIENVAQYIGSRRKPYSYEEEVKFVKGKLEGQGTMTYADGTVRSGKWKDGKFVG